MLAMAGLATAHASQTVRESWDDMNLLGSLYPANQSVTNDPSSVGFVASSPWITNPAEHANNTLLSIRDFFPEPWVYGLPPNYDGTTVALCQDNSFPGGAGGSLWTSGDWMVRQLQPSSQVNFNANGEYWLELHVGFVFDAQYAGDIPASGAGGIGFADGTTTNAHFVAIGVTGTNLFLGPPDGGNPFGTIPASKSDFISQGTLGQPGNPNSLIYNPQNDPGGYPGGTNYQGGLAILTNFTGGPYFVNAFGTNRQGQLQGDAIMILGHLVTHAGGNATMQVKFYNQDFSDVLDITNSGIAWDCSYSFNFTGTMDHMLVFENGEFPLYIYDFRVGTSLEDVVGLDSLVRVSPDVNPPLNNPLNFTNYVGEANPVSNPTLSGNANYGTFTFQWQQNGINISSATSSNLNIASVSTSDPGMPAGTDNGTYTCITTDSSGIWGAVTSAPVVISILTNISPPTITSVTPSPDLSTITVVYSQIVNAAAGVAGNYLLNNGVTVTNATAQAIGSQTVVTLQTTGEPQAARLTLTVNNVQSLANKALTPNTATFWTEVYTVGAVNYYAWLDGNGYSAASFYAAYPTQDTPTPAPGFTAVYNSWEVPGTVNVTPAGGGATGNNSYGAHMYGWFIPPVTTNYVFFLSADDACRLSISTNSAATNMITIAAEDLWSPSDNWTNYSTAFPTGDHRGNGNNTNLWGLFGGPNGGWDAGPDQNRSDEFLLAYNQEAQGLWTNEFGSVASVVQSATTFWPTVDANGNAVISLVAGQKYYMLAEHLQEFGGANLSVSYKFAGTTNNRQNDPATGATSLLTGNSISAIAPFKLTTLSATISGTNLMVTYNGILSASTSVNGPYVDLGGAPVAGTPTQFAIPITGGALFVRSHE